jgi:hypothetical protein
MQDHRKDEVVRRTSICATLATLTTIGLFSLVASLMSQAAVNPRPAAIDDGIPVLEVTVIRAKREPVPIARADGDPAKAQRLELI